MQAVVAALLAIRAWMSGNWIPQQIEKSFLDFVHRGLVKGHLLLITGAFGHAECRAMPVVGVRGFFGGSAAVVPLVIGGPGVGVAFVDAQVGGVETIFQI